MSGVEAQAWWEEVEDVRARIERRRAREAGTDHRGEGTGRRPGVAPAWDAARPRGEAARIDDDTPAARRPGVARAWDGPTPSEAPMTTRRTVRIRGQAIPAVVAPRLRPVEEPASDSLDLAPRPAVRTAARAYARRPRPRTHPAERLAGNPDRLAAWAFGLALLALLVAAISAHGL